jgi:FkbM family methyltransferase
MNILQDISSKLIREELPVVFYGTSLAAKKVFKFFQQYGLEVDYFIVSSQYYHPGMVFCNKYVYDIKSPPPHAKVNVLVMFGITDEYLDLLKKSFTINHLYLIDGAACSLGSFSRKYIDKHIKAYHKTYEMLEDNYSQEAMLAFLNSRISADASFIRPYYTSKTYYQNDLLHFGNGEIFVDCGACEGDTVKAFKEEMSSLVCDYEKIYAIEPDKSNFIHLEKYLTSDPSSETINKAVWKKQKKLKFAADLGGASSVVTKQKNIKTNNMIEVYAEKLDTILNGKKVTFIKMDLEGAELNALKGAKETIRKYKPRLAIAVYHKIEDLIEIPKYITSLNRNYKFYLRALTPDTTDFTLFAID